LIERRSEKLKGYSIKGSNKVLGVMEEVYNKYRSQKSGEDGSSRRMRLQERELLENYIVKTILYG